MSKTLHVLDGSIPRLIFFVPTQFIGDHMYIYIIIILGIQIEYLCFIEINNESKLIGIFLFIILYPFTMN